MLDLAQDTCSPPSVTWPLHEHLVFRFLFSSRHDALFRHTQHCEDGEMVLGEGEDGDLWRRGQGEFGAEATRLLARLIWLDCGVVKLWVSAPSRCTVGNCMNYRTVRLYCGVQVAMTGMAYTIYTARICLLDQPLCPSRHSRFAFRGLSSLPETTCT